MKPNAFLFFCIILVLIVYYTIEYVLHKRTISSFTHRIHVNGTRGKSSVTRLIRAGLSSMGIKVFAKTTGTMAREIHPDGTEYSIRRYGKPSILEQIKILKKAKSTGAGIVVIECMALEPRYQWASEALILKSDIGVLTNIREDHLDVMGPSLFDVAKSLASSIPIAGTVFTGKHLFNDLMTYVTKDRNTKYFPWQTEDENTVNQKEMEMFPYWEHKENVSLALKVCIYLGADRKKALEAMWQSKPDPGALTITPIHFYGNHFLFINAMAANDPNSTKFIWNETKTRFQDYKHRIILFHVREDRADRSIQLMKEISNWKDYDSIIFIGTGTNIAVQSLKESTTNDVSIFIWENFSLDEIFESLLSVLPKQSIVFAIGNIVGLGMDLTQYLKNRSEQII
ncbi:poly-gamma-glutamate synthase PgsB [Leptospira sp. 96542]|nr:poly-gamma-glutamate synthase PgsB [Leptospira sp. 96542]